MQRTRHHAIAAAAAHVITCAGLASTCYGQEEFLWTRPSGLGDWNDATNWSNLTLGGVASGFPDRFDTARFDTSASVFGGEVGGLTVNAPATLTFGDLGQLSTSTSILGTITNNGSIGFVPDAFNNSFFRIDQRVFVPQFETATLAGSGALTLNGFETGIEGDAVFPRPTLINGPDHTINGFGTIGDLTVINQGAIIADVVAFLQLFGAEDPTADLAAPFDRWEIGDVVAFLNGVGGGCP